MACCGQGVAARAAPRSTPKSLAMEPAAITAPGARVMVSVKSSVVISRSLAIPGGKLLVINPGMAPFCLPEIHANMFSVFLEVTGPCPA